MKPRTARAPTPSRSGSAAAAPAIQRVRRLLARAGVFIVAALSTALPAWSAHWFPTPEVSAPSDILSPGGGAVDGNTGGGVDCQDGVQNQDETDVDCGGNTCAPCANGSNCNVDGDCANNICTPAKTCGDCREDGDCPGSGMCVQGMCQECASDTDCTGDLKRCGEGGECVQCASDAGRS